MRPDTRRRGSADENRDFLPDSPSKKNLLPRTTTSPARIVPFGMEIGAFLGVRARANALPESEAEREANRPTSVKRVGAAHSRASRQPRGAPACEARARRTPGQPPREERERGARSEEGAGESRPRARRAGRAAAAEGARRASVRRREAPAGLPPCPRPSRGPTSRTPYRGPSDQRGARKTREAGREERRRPRGRVPARPSPGGPPTVQRDAPP